MILAFSITMHLRYGVWWCERVRFKLRLHAHLHEKPIVKCTFSLSFSLQTENLRFSRFLSPFRVFGVSWMLLLFFHLFRRSSRMHSNVVHAMLCYACGKNRDNIAPKFMYVAHSRQSNAISHTLILILHNFKNIILEKGPFFCRSNCERSVEWCCCCCCYWHKNYDFFFYFVSKISLWIAVRNARGNGDIHACEWSKKTAEARQNKEKGHLFLGKHKKNATQKIE